MGGASQWAGQRPRAPGSAGSGGHGYPAAPSARQRAPWLAWPGIFWCTLASLACGTRSETGTPLRPAKVLIIWNGVRGVRAGAHSHNALST